MLKNINLHIHSNEEEQDLIESELALKVDENSKESKNALQRFIPSLAQIVSKHSQQRYSILCTKNNEFNIVDLGLGRVIYGFHPKQESLDQVEYFKRKSPYVSLLESEHKCQQQSESPNPLSIRGNSQYGTLQNYSPLPKQVNCLVIFGIGLGFHIETLLDTHDIKHLIIYEPEIEFFTCSTMIAPWKKILEIAKDKNTTLYIQLGKDGREIVSDISQLREHFSIKGFYFLQHYQHPIFNSISSQLNQRSWLDIEEKGVYFQHNESYLNYTPPWCPPIDIETLSCVSEKSSLLKKNLDALKKFFPEIYRDFKDYIPKIWIPVKSPNGDINIVKKDTLTNWHGNSPRDESYLNFENFKTHPNRDGLILGYNGQKLAHYKHYQFVRATEKLLTDIEEQSGALPQNISSIILFGLATGYQLEYLLDEHRVERLFICEPNSDLFYSSLFAIDWAKILESFRKNNGRIYINIGDDGSNLMKDLLNQFYSIGPYLLNNTYFYQCYYNSGLSKAIAELREQLKIVIAMGEYFDHAYYGISQTLEGIKRGYPIMKSRPDQYLHNDDKEVPVFIIGNGPSLDFSISAIKEYQDKAIIISCGTALKALKNNEIKPDFHAEIEQNRATYDWASMVNDRALLKSIPLISCNGIHPDTADLYQEVFISFKEGESSTVSVTELLKKNTFELLNFAFPTVANLVANWIVKLGFKNVYFLGVDLGWVDKKSHHSKHSDYYDNMGNESLDYHKDYNLSIAIPGNLQPEVLTKHEFKVAKQILEGVLANADKSIDFFNCSNGAKINGATPLRVDDILITTTQNNKFQAINNIKNNCYCSGDELDLLKKFTQHYDKYKFISDIDSFITLNESEINCYEEAENLINMQKEVLFKSYRDGDSLLFYYLYGSVNYANAVMSKLLLAKHNEGELVPQFEKCKMLWCDFLKQIRHQVDSGLNPFDRSDFKVFAREALLNRVNCNDKKLAIISDNNAFHDSILYHVNEQLKWPLELESIQTKYTNRYSTLTYDYCIVELPSHCNSLSESQAWIEKSLSHIHSRTRIIIVLTLSSYHLCRQLAETHPNVLFLSLEGYDLADFNILRTDTLYITINALQAALQDHTANVIIPKTQIIKEEKVKFKTSSALFGFHPDDLVHDYYWYLTVNIDQRNTFKTLSPNGTRGLQISSPPEIENRIGRTFSKSEYENLIQACMDSVPSLNV